VRSTLAEGLSSNGHLTTSDPLVGSVWVCHSCSTGLGLRRSHHAIGFSRIVQCKHCLQRQFRLAFLLRSILWFVVSCGVPVESLLSIQLCSMAYVPQQHLALRVVCNAALTT
jgi:hypothetical protein